MFHRLVTSQTLLVKHLKLAYQAKCFTFCHVENIASQTFEISLSSKMFHRFVMLQTIARQTFEISLSSKMFYRFVMSKTLLVKHLK